MNPKPVVVGVQGKQPAALAFAAAAAVARGVGLRVVHCVDPVLVGEFSGVSDATLPAPGEDVLEQAKEVIQGLPAQPRAEYVLSVRGAYGELVDEIERGSLLVVGTDPASTFERFFGGRVTERLLKHATIPVAVVPEGYRQADDAGSVVVAVDAKSRAAGPLRFAFEEAQRRDGRLYVAHVAPLDTPFEEIESLRVDISEILAGWSEEFPDITVTRRFIFDESDDGCLRATAEAELLVLGRLDGPHVPWPFAHPVLTRVAREAHCPCVVVPDEWQE